MALRAAARRAGSRLGCLSSLQLAAAVVPQAALPSSQGAFLGLLNSVTAEADAARACDSSGASIVASSSLPPSWSDESAPYSQVLSKLSASFNRRLLHSSSGGFSAAGSGAEDFSDLDSLPQTLDQDAESTIGDPNNDLTPLQIVEQLDRFIVGQPDAKRAVAIAMRNRWRRHRLAETVRNEVVPKNILMIGPTGCGKTEIARRLAKLANAPFIKVEATKFTEVGFHGRDVDQIIRDLVDIAVELTKTRMRERVRNEVKVAVENRLLDALVGAGDSSSGGSRETFREMLRAGDLDERSVEIEMPAESRQGRMQLENSSVGVALTDVFLKFERALNKGRSSQERKSMKISEWRPILEDAEAERMLNEQLVQKEAIQSVEQDGIVFIDEIDKIVTPSDSLHGADASSEGVQRDLLPIIEGSAVTTRHGTVNTDHILFIASGAFHSCKPSDMLAELQGRLPIRVELKGLTRQDLYRILTEPEHNLIRQQQQLLATEKVELEFTDDAIKEIAAVAAEVNRTVENIGARRLHTIMERVVEEISFSAPELMGKKVVIDKPLITEKVGPMLLKTDLSKFIL